MKFRKRSELTCCWRWGGMEPCWWAPMTPPPGGKWLGPSWLDVVTVVLLKWFACWYVRCGGLFWCCSWCCWLFISCGCGCSLVSKWQTGTDTGTMQASSNREENRTVLSFMAHLSLTFFRVDRACRVYPNIYFRDIKEMRVYFHNIEKCYRKQRDIAGRIAQNFLITWFFKPREIYQANDIAICIGTFYMRVTSIVWSLFDQSKATKQKVNVIINGQHDNTTRTTIMWHDDHRSVQAHRNRSCRYKLLYHSNMIMYIV